jgi:hypothetical protein
MNEQYARYASSPMHQSNHEGIDDHFALPAVM